MAFYSENYGFFSPTIKITTQTDINNGFISFLINANSTDELKQLTVSVYIHGEKIQEVHYDLNNGNKASVSYYYFTGNTKNKEITFIFTVKDSQATRKIIREIYL